MFQVKSIRLKWTPSLKVILASTLLLFSILPLLIQSMVTMATFQQNQIDARIQDIQNQTSILSTKMTRAAYLQTEPRDSLLDNEMSVKADAFNGRIVIVDGNFKIVKDTFSLSEGRFNISEEVIRCFKGENSSKYNQQKHYTAMTVPIYSDLDNKTVDGVMVITSTTEDLLLQMDSISEKIRFLQLVLFSVLSVVAILFIKILLKPFERLQSVLNRVAEGNMDDKITVTAYRETKEITEAVNKTLTKLKVVDESREEFVSNVSHELKTPITSIRVLADSLMAMEEVPVELYREFMTDISDEIDRESKIIDDLLTLVKMDKTAGTELNIAQVNINALLELILKRLRPIAKKRNVELTLESIRDVTADADEVKLSLALNNLVENAIKYNVDGGWVRVTLDADHKFLYIKVSDSGIGIPEEYQEHIFERFYRVDKARSREKGGTGLGLSITKNVILLHQGAIKVTGKEGEGSTFVVRLPLTYIS